MNFLKNTRLQAAVLFALPLLLYANTLGHGFVLDDVVVITENKFVQQGLKGIPAIFSKDTFAGYAPAGEQESLLAGGRYRPLSLAFFALLFQFFGANGVLFHAFAILLYALSGAVLFRLLRLMLANIKQGETMAFAATLLFIVHPVHTEVVANIKSSDEQLALLLGLGAVRFIFKKNDKGGVLPELMAGLLFLLACLAKENAIMLTVMTPLALWFFRKTNFTSMLRHSWPIWAAGLLFLAIRGMATGWQVGGQVMHDPLNNPFLTWSGSAWVPCTMAEKAATILYTFGEYVRLMVWPHPLTFDYYPFQIAIQSFQNPAVWVSTILLLAMAGYGFWSLRRREVGGFGVLFFLIMMSITANVFFTVGAFMGERFLYLPSVGFCLTIAAWAVYFFAEKNYRFVLPVFALLLVLFAAITVLRNPAWASNETLFRTDVAHSPNSAKLRYDLGLLLLLKSLKPEASAQRQALQEEALLHLKTAVDLHPTYYDAHLAYGACAYYLQQYKPSVDAYRRAFELYPEDQKGKLGLLYALQGYGNNLAEKGDTTAAIACLNEAWSLQPHTATAASLSAIYQSQAKYAEAIAWMEKAVAIVPEDAKMNYSLAKVYKAAGEMAKAQAAYQKATSIDPALGPL